MVKPMLRFRWTSQKFSGIEPQPADKFKNLKTNVVKEYAGMWVMRKTDIVATIAIKNMFVDESFAVEQAKKNGWWQGLGTPSSKAS